MKKKIKFSKCIISFLLIFGLLLIFLSSLFRHIENRKMLNKICIVPSIQYINIYKNEKLYFNLTIIDTKKLINKGNLQTYLIEKNGVKVKTKVQSINKISANVKKCNMYNVILSAKIPSKTKKEYYYWEIRQKDKIEILKIGRLCVNQMNFSEKSVNKKLKIMATLKSVDGESFSLILKNMSTDPLRIQEIDCGIRIKNWKSSKKEQIVSIKGNEEKEIRLKLHDKVKNNFLAIRPIIKYSIKGEVFCKLTSANIIFEKDNFTKQEIVDLLDDRVIKDER